MGTGIWLIFEWENGIGFTRTGMPIGGNRKEINEMGLGYINHKKVSIIIRF